MDRDSTAERLDVEHKEILELLPPTDMSLHQNPSCKTPSRPLTSAFVPKYTVGCNDDILSVTTEKPGFITPSHLSHCKEARDWTMKLRANTLTRTSTI